MLPAKPLTKPTETEYVADCPALTVAAVGEGAETVKSGITTTSVTVVVWTSDPLVPLMAGVEVPGAVLVDVFMVSVALPGTATELADRDAVVLLGVPLTTRVAVPEKPPTEASEMPNEPLSPRATVSDGGDA